MDFLYDWELHKLEALYRAAKRCGFFKDPHSMIRLREILMERRENEAS